MSHPIPQPPGVPLLGNIFDVDPSNTWTSLKTLADKYGEIFQIKVLGQTIVFVAGASLAEELCDETRFRKYVGGPVVEIRHAVHDALFTAYDDEPAWGVAHRICAPRLSRDSVAASCGEMVQVTQELLAKWQTTGNNNGDDGFALIDDLNRLNLEATTLTLFGVKLDCIAAARPHPMLAAMEAATAEAMKRPTRPALLNWLVHGRKFRGATRAMRDGYAADILRQRRGPQPADRKDLLAAMLGATDPASGAALLSESRVIDEIVSMPIGSSTAPCLLATAVYYLLRNPQCVARARAEIDEVVGKDTLRAEHVPRLKYVEGVVREALRLSFAAPGFNIEPRPSENNNNNNNNKAPVMLGGGKYSVRHDQAMIVVLAGVNRDPSVFAEPEAFRPERMMGDAYAALPAGVKKGFGNGKRECIGRHWAWQFSMVVLAMLIRAVDFEAVDAGYELRQDGWFNLRPVGFRVRAHVR